MKNEAESQAVFAVSYVRNVRGRAILPDSTVISSVEMVVSEIKDNKPVKTDISIILLNFTSIVSAFIPQFLLFKGHNQALHNTRNQNFSMQLPVLQKTK